MNEILNAVSVVWVSDSNVWCVMLLHIQDANRIDNRYQ